MDRVLAGFSYVGMACFVVMMLVVSIWGISDNFAKEQAKVTPRGATYQEAYQWCEGTFAGEEDLKRSCQWGAYTTTVGTDTQVTVEASR